MSDEMYRNYCRLKCMGTVFTESCSSVPANLETCFFVIKSYTTVYVDDVN